MHSEKPPLVSVIIPCYNHGNFLQEAIDSVLQQTYAAIEVIVVDDGSTDNSGEIAKQIQCVKYIYQKNKGLAAARNKGIELSSGDYLVFLDADDFLYPDALAVNLAFLQADAHLAFIAGSHNRVYTYSHHINPVVKEVPSAYYTQLLKGNFIGMHATVMFRKWVFDKYTYDASLKACEDYDLYLKVARKHPVRHHAHIVAAYRIHNANMSGNPHLMLASAMKVLKRQKKYLKGNSEKQAYKEGQAFWKNYYLPGIYQRLTPGTQLSKEAFRTLWKYDRPFLCDYLYQQNIRHLRAWGKYTPSVIKKAVKIHLLKK